MGSESLHTLLLTNIPQLGKRIASTRYELVVVEGVDELAHEIAQVVGELVYLGASFQVPKHAGHVAGRGKNSLVADESAAGQVP